MTEAEHRQIFDLWLHEHKGILFKVVRSYAQYDADREDLFQEIALQVWRSVPGFKQNAAVSTWLYRIALNQAIKWSVKTKKERERQEYEEIQGVLRPQEEVPDERLAWLYEQIHQLEAVDRSLCLLLLDGYSYKEMASIVGISENYVGVKINRVKKHLTEQSKKM